MQLSLKQADQQKLNHILTTSAKTQANILKFSQLTMLLLDRSVFCHRFTFKDYYTLFQRAFKIKNKKDLGKDMLQGEKILGRQQLIFLFNQIGKMMYGIPNNNSNSKDVKLKGTAGYQQRFYNQFLTEKVDVNQGEFHSARVPAFDQLNRKLVLEEVIEILAEYQDQLKNVYTVYLIQNYFSLKKSKRLLLSQRQIRLQNKRWPYTSLILFLKQSQTTPHLATIDHLEQTLRQIVPHVNQKQQQFYSKHVILDTYHKQAQLDRHQGTSHVGDPGLYFHEFLLLIGRIAWQCYPKQMEKKNMKEIIVRYFNYMFVRKNEDIDKVALPNLNRKMITKMKQFYKFLQSSKQQQIQNKKQTSQTQSQIDVLTKRIKNQVMNSADLGLDFGQTLKSLQKQLPKLPPVPVVVPQAPGPYNKADAITIGQQPPPQPVDKQKGAKQQKKSGNNKQQVPARVFLWQDMPTTKTAIQDHLKSVQNKITFEVQPLNDISRGTIRKQSYPVIIGQTLFPGELPKSVVPFLKQASQALNDRNFVLALQSYENGLKAWKKTQVEIDPASELFFQYSKGNVYLSIGKLQYALQAFYGCRKFADTNKLPFNNPDRSLPYFGLGEVFFQMQQYTLAARSFLKAREIRQNVLGLQHVQTATVFNNLACCFFMLGRSHEALGYIQIAQVVFDTQLGEHHERTMTSRNNLKKITSGTFDNQPQYRKFWQVFEQDKFEKKKKKKQKQGKKK